MGEGASRPRYILAENGSEYIIKGPALSPANPYVAANELIAAHLAQSLGLPVLDFAIVEMGGKLFFASAWMPPGSFYPAIRRDLFDRRENRDSAYDLVVFDAWLCNMDRHADNLIVRNRTQRGNPDQLSLVLNDHSHCLLPPTRRPFHLALLVNSRATDYVRIDFIRDAIVDRERLAIALDAIEQLDEDLVRTFVRLVPEEFLAGPDQSSVESFLIERKTTLRQAFNDSSRSFVALQGGEL
ncbi:MAG: HipA family kinase [Thermomicrobiales bacterium]